MATIGFFDRHTAGLPDLEKGENKTRNLDRVVMQDMSKVINTFTDAARQTARLAAGDGPHASQMKQTNAALIAGLRETQNRPVVEATPEVTSTVANKA